MAVAVCTFARIGWRFVDAITINAGRGNLRLLNEAPGAVAIWAKRAARTALWAKLGAKDEYSGLGIPCLGPLRRLLNRKASGSWSQRTAGCLRSIVIGSQWPQARLRQAGLTADDKCQLCGDTGTLRHRCWDCPVVCGRPADRGTRESNTLRAVLLEQKTAA